MRPVSLRWHVAASVLIVSLLSVAAGAGAMLVAGHQQNVIDAERARERAAGDAAVDIDALWQRTAGRLVALSSALGDTPNDQQFGVAVGALDMLDSTIVYVRFEHGGTMFERPVNGGGAGPEVVFEAEDTRLRAEVARSTIDGIVDRHAAHLGPGAALSWDANATAGQAVITFGGAVTYAPAAAGPLVFEAATVVNAAGTGLAVAVTSAIGAAVAATVLVRPLRRFEADARALAEGRKPGSHRGVKELAGIATSMQNAAADVARDRHDLQLVQEKLGASLRKQTQVVADQEARLRRLFEGISHDIKGPLITANVLLQQVQRDAAGEHESLDRALVALHRLRALVHQLSLLSRASSEPTMAPFDLAPIIKQAAESCKRADTQGRNVQWSGPKVVLRSDAERLRIALAMLIDNGLRHGGDVRIQWVSGPVPSIEIADNGPGFAFTPEMFEPFAVRNDRPGVAAGLGLAIANRLVRSLGGGLKISSDASGTRCAIFLPGGQ